MLLSNMGIKQKRKKKREQKKRMSAAEENYGVFAEFSWNWRSLEEAGSLKTILDKEMTVAGRFIGIGWSVIYSFEFIFFIYGCRSSL